MTRTGRHGRPAPASVITTAEVSAPAPRVIPNEGVRCLARPRVPDSKPRIHSGEVCRLLPIEGPVADTLL
jgi:hypothetical protein